MDKDGSSPKPQHASLARVMATLLLAASTVLSNPLSTEASDLPIGKKYYSIMESGEPNERVAANTALMEYAVGTISNMYYDASGGAHFNTRDFYKGYKYWLNEQGKVELQTRDGVVSGLEWLVAQLNDPYCAYLTREELRGEVIKNKHGFLGLGAVVEPPKPNTPFFGTNTASVMANLPPGLLSSSHTGRKAAPVLSAVQVSKLPVVTAVAPDSPAEKAGLVVGDRVVGVGLDNFLQHPSETTSRLVKKYSSAENYVGHSSLTIAKPVYASSVTYPSNDDDVASSLTYERDVIVAYRPTHVRIETSLTADTDEAWKRGNEPNIDGGMMVAGGDSLVHYQLLRARNTIFDRHIDIEQNPNEVRSVGYIRLTCFSKSATTGFVNAVNELEKNGATSFIIDLRNNYGGVIQEAMLTASSLMRDPHAVLCYTMNSRGGFTPHDVEEYVLDNRYPGYFMSSESRSVVMQQVKHDKPENFEFDSINWVPPGSFASLREQTLMRGLHRVSDLNAPKTMEDWNSAAFSPHVKTILKQRAAQKKIVVLVNEGTASSAEFFASALRDNGRTVALIGTKTFGKGLIQHIFPMPDGGGLKITVAEYLTPSLHHVTRVGGANFDPASGEWVGGGVSPDIRCESRQGIPRNIGADLCVGMALDELD